MQEPPSPPKSSFDDMLAVLKAHAGTREGIGSRGPPPVDKWNPVLCGDIGMEIMADGTWMHEGTRITREALVRLFATILRKDEDGQTYLVTPGEKIVVKVHDAPFVAIRADRHGEGREQQIVFTTNVGDVITAGPDNPIRVERNGDEPRPYVLVRGRLEARILRAPFYELVEWAEPRGGQLGSWSGGVCFELGGT
jgi:uncharacterized protein